MKLSNTIYAMNIAIDTLIKRIDSKECNDKEIHYYLGKALLWTGLTLEKIENSGMSKGSGHYATTVLVAILCKI